MSAMVCRNDRPSPNGDNGRRANRGDRDACGRFTQGNAGGPGNPHARRTERLRALILESVTDQDLADIVRTLVRCAKTGEPWAVRELLDRCIGKAGPAAGDAEDADDADGVISITIRHVEQPLAHRG